MHLQLEGLKRPCSFLHFSASCAFMASSQTSGTSSLSLESTHVVGLLSSGLSLDSMHVVLTSTLSLESTHVVGLTTEFEDEVLVDFDDEVFVDFDFEMEVLLETETETEVETETDLDFEQLKFLSRLVHLQVDLWNLPSIFLHFSASTALILLSQTS
jgi:hypothetical protein